MLRFCPCDADEIAAREIAQRARTRIGTLADEVREYYWNFRVEPRLLELRNLIQVADLIIDCALQRHESRGLHYSLDFPDTLPKALPTVLNPARKLPAQKRD